MCGCLVIGYDYPCRPPSYAFHDIMEANVHEDRLSRMLESHVDSVQPTISSASAKYGIEAAIPLWVTDHDT